MSNVETYQEYTAKLASAVTALYMENCITYYNSTINGNTIVRSKFTTPDSQVAQKIFNLLLVTARKEKPLETTTNLRSDCGEAIREYIIFRELVNIK